MTQRHRFYPSTGQRIPIPPTRDRDADDDEDEEPAAEMDPYSGPTWAPPNPRKEPPR